MSPRATTRTLPAIQPIIPELQATPFDHPDWVFEPKYDGFRGLLHITPAGAAFKERAWRKDEYPTSSGVLPRFGMNAG